MTRKYGIDTNDQDNETYDTGKELTEQIEAAIPVTSEDIKFVIDVMKKEAPHDETSIKQLFYGMASAFTKLPIPHNVNSKDPGSGKSYLLVLVSGYYPDAYVIPLTGMSDKALLHQQGTMVKEDPVTEETEPIEPIILGLESRIEELETEIDELRKSSNEDKKGLIKRNKKEIKEIQSEIGSIREHAIKLVVLDNRIILMLDTPQEGLINALMSMISQDVPRDQRYAFTDKSGSGKLEATTNRFSGTPTIFSCQVVDDTRQTRFREKNRRFIHVTPDTSINKIEAAKRQIGLRYGLLPEEYDKSVLSKSDKEKAKEIVSRIVKKLIEHSKFFGPKQSGIKIPFVNSISRGIGGDPNDVWGMTVMDRTVRYLSIVTKVNMDSKPKIIDMETGAAYPIATFDDLEETLQLMATASSGLRPYIVTWYNKVFIPAFKSLNGEPREVRSEKGNLESREIYAGLTTKELADKTKEILHNARPSTQDIRQYYLDPLVNLGIIDKSQSVLNKKENIYFPAEEEGNLFDMFQDSRDLRLKITSCALYPCKALLEESFRTIIKRNDKWGVVQNEKYLLVDSDGRTEISVQELIDRYLSNPEIAFKAEGFMTKKELEQQKLQTVLKNLSYSQGLVQKNIFSNTPPVCRYVLRKSSKNDREESTIQQRSNTEPVPKPEPPIATSIKISNTYARGSQVLLVRNPLDFLLSTVHPSLFDNSIDIEFVTAKTRRKLLYLQRRPYYYSCYYCYDIHKATFDSLDEYERHIVTAHKPMTVGYPGQPDLEKYDLERVRRKQGRNRLSKLAEMPLKQMNQGME